MTASTREILRKVGCMVPPMLSKFHKGQLGRVAVLGGSEDYSGAPYFSAIASARLGCDMSHVICTPSAASIIKTYSPNLMVHPLMRESKLLAAAAPAENADDICSRIVDFLPRVHVLVVGPGLGQDDLMLDTAALVVRAARDHGIPVVLDADSLLLVSRCPDLVRGWATAVLTPNAVEFDRLCHDLGVDTPEMGSARLEALARRLGGVTIVQKGERDFIANGHDATLVVEMEGGRKRCGGQGDTLAGCIATFLAWRKAYMDHLWESDGERLKEDEMVALAAFGGCAITRESSRLAFQKRGRSLQASDLTGEVHPAFLTIFGEADDQHPISFDD